LEAVGGGPVLDIVIAELLGARMAGAVDLEDNGRAKKLCFDVACDAAPARGGLVLASVRWGEARVIVF
jgi:hypothetical protein